jgi:hypothetical protein
VILEVLDGMTLRGAHMRLNVYDMTPRGAYMRLTVYAMG